MSDHAPRICIQTGKRSFTSKAAARRRTKRLGARLRPYHCTHCRGWHVANQEKR